MYGNYIPMGVYRCCCSMTRYESFLGFQYVKNKARDIRLLKYLVSHTAKKELFPDGIPGGYYTTSGVKTIQKYKFYFNYKS